MAHGEGILVCGKTKIRASAQPLLLYASKFILDGCAIDKGTIAVGAWRDDVAHSVGSGTNYWGGSVFTFEMDSTGYFQETQRINNPELQHNERLGYAVDVFDNKISAAAYYHSLDMNDSNFLDAAGASYVYQKKNGSWEEVYKFTSTKRLTYGFFGNSTAIWGNHVVTGNDLGGLDTAGLNPLTDAGIAFFSTVCPGYSKNIHTEICYGDSLWFNEQYLRDSGEYYHYIADTSFCDTIITLHLDVRPKSQDTLDFTVCTGDTVKVDSNDFTNQGIYELHYSGFKNCDSTVYININHLPSSVDTIHQTICSDDSVYFDHSYYRTPGFYTSYLQNRYNCDSTTILELKVLPIYKDTLDTEICHGDSIYFAGSYRKTGGVYQQTYNSVANCDSIIVMDLEVTVLDTHVVRSTGELKAPTGMIYQWLECTPSGYKSLSGEVNQSYTITKNGSYAVALSDGFCQDTSACYPINDISTYEFLVNSPSLKAFPNPTEGKVSFSESISGYVTGLDGSRVQTFRNQKSIDLSALPSGIYLISTTQGEILKIFKE